MSQNSRLLDPGRAALDRPPCPKCHAPMMLAAVTSRTADIDTRTYECVVGRYTEKITADTGE